MQGADAGATSGETDGKRPVKRRGPRGARREQILVAATHLFVERGFHNVGIDDIGEAAGISGPGVYRHFANKEALLFAALSRAGDRTAAALPDVGTGAEVDLSDLMRRYVDVVVDNADLIALYRQEEHNLSNDQRRELQRPQRQVQSLFVEALLRHRPKLSPKEARFVVRCALAAAHAAPNRARRVADERLRELVFQTAMGALSAG